MCAMQEYTLHDQIHTEERVFWARNKTFPKQRWPGVEEIAN